MGRVLWRGAQSSAKHSPGNPCIVGPDELSGGDILDGPVRQVRARSDQAERRGDPLGRSPSSATTSGVSSTGLLNRPISGRVNSETDSFIPIEKNY